MASSCGDMALFPAPVVGLTYLVQPLLGEVFFEIPAGAAGDDDDVGARGGELVHGPSVGVLYNRGAVQLCNGTAHLLMFYPFGAVFPGNGTEAAL